LPDTEIPVAFADETHDHSRCVADAMAAAEARCADRGVRLTAQRRRVLELLLEGHAPVGAYDILARLSTEGRPTAPVAVYRALDFLREHGLAHRLASLNAFVACARPGREHGAQFLICSHCRAVAELDDGAIGRAVRGAAQEAGFAIDWPVIEIGGICPACREAGDG
jgi:Fur family zinc uptake transcriptional regulator